MRTVAHRRDQLRGVEQKRLSGIEHGARFAGTLAGDAGVVSGLFNTTQQIGGALGLAVLSTLAANRTADRLAALGHPASAEEHAQALVSGYHVGFLAGAGLMGLGVVLVAALVRKRHVLAISGGDVAVPSVPLAEAVVAETATA